METVTRKPYSTDLTDEQWAILEPLIPPAKHGGQPYGASLAFGAAVSLGLPSHMPSRERPLLYDASFILVRLPPAHGCLQQAP